MSCEEHYKEADTNYSVLVQAYIFSEKVIDRAYNNASS
jgi:hypothetical protein